MNKWLRYILIAALAFGLLLVRYYEADLFYDPFIPFFKGEYYYLTMPKFEWSEVLLSMGFRYGINMLLSLGIIYLVFKEKNVVKASLSIYALCFVVLLTVFAILLAKDSSSLTALFYVRRFIIQPILLLLLLPAFYYHKLKN
ncbi:MAG: exosortase F system-associated protein [Gilvibacter sp.]